MTRTQLPRTNLRPDPTPFVGREADLEVLADALSEARLVSLTGPPGVGKTRLAKELGLLQTTATWCCDLSGAVGPDSIASALAHALEVPLSAGRSTREAVLQLAAALRRRGPALVVLDNFEHVVTHAPATLGVWLTEAPETRFVTTSRQKLDLPGERVVELRPLGQSAARGHEPEAVRLFVARARAVRPGFALSEAERPIVRQLVARLDGLPLAIELAAARVGVLGLAQLLDRIEHSLRALDKSGAADRSTLRGALEWSWELLTPAEKDTLAAVSAFAGGFDAGAAEAVTGLGEAELLDALDALRTRSLVVCHDEPGGVRFSLLATIRELAHDKLEAGGQLLEIHARHAAYFLERGKLWSDGIDGPRALEHMRQLSLERDNFHAVHVRELGQEPLTAEHAERSIQAVLALERPCIVREPVEGYVAMLENALAAAERLGADRRLRAEALRMRAALYLFLGRPEETTADNRAALALARELCDEALEARLLAALALTGLRRVPIAPSEMPARLIEARHGLEDALERYPHRDARRGIFLNNLGVVLESLGAHDDAEARYDEAVACYRGTPCTSAGVALASRGSLHLGGGRLAEAQADLTRALEMVRAFGDRRTEAYVLAELGALYLEQGLARAARDELEACLSCHADFGLSWFEGAALACFGDLELWLGEPEAAAARYHAALEVARHNGDAKAQARALAGVGMAEAGRGAVAAATEALAAAATLADDPVGRALVDVGHGALDLARAESAECATSERDALDRAKSRLAASAEASMNARSVVLRLARRQLDAALRSHVERRAAASAGHALAVTGDGKWFRLPTREAVSLHRRQALALILQCLLERRIDAPGAGLSLDELFRAGWPGDRADAHSAALRVHQAIATLRKLGLRQLLLRKEDGYLLDPEHPVLRVAKPDA